MKRPLYRRGVYRRGVALLLALVPLVAGKALADDKQTLDAARAAYCSLRREGLASFSCLVTPNWDLLLAARWRTDPTAAAKAYKTFSGLTFGVEVGNGPRAKVTHADVPDSESEALKRLAGGIEQTVSGFVDAWSPFVLTSPIPAAGTSTAVAEAHGLKIVDFKQGALSVGLVMRDDYTIDSTHIVTDTFASEIQPQFVKSPKGLLLTAIQGSYRKLPSGAPLSLQLRIEYQDVSGFLLPKCLHVSSNDGRTVSLMDLGFGTCQAQHR